MDALILYEPLLSLKEDVTLYLKNWNFLDLWMICWMNEKPIRIKSTVCVTLNLTIKCIDDNGLSPYSSKRSS